MAAKQFNYTKISELPAVTNITGSDVLVVNASGNTSKIAWSDLLNLIQAAVSGDIAALAGRVTTLEGTTSNLASTVADNSTTIDNIITAGFNLIGRDVTNG